MREYKQKTYTCGKCKTVGKQKVQAEVDVAIAVKMIEFAQLPNVKSITLLAGDRDFMDSIKHV